MSSCVNSSSSNNSSNSNNNNNNNNSNNNSNNNNNSNSNSNSNNNNNLKVSQVKPGRTSHTSRLLRHTSRLFTEPSVEHHVAFIVSEKNLP